MTMDWARAFAGKVIAAAGEDEQKQIDTAYQMAFDRKPTQSESQAVVDFLRRHEPIIEERLAKMEKIALPEKMPAGMSKAHGGAGGGFFYKLVYTEQVGFTQYYHAHTSPQHPVEGPRT